MKKIFILLFLFCLISPCLAYNETYANPEDAFVYPEGFEMYGYVSYANDTLVPLDSKVVVSNENGIEVGRSYVDEFGMYGVDSKKIYDEKKLDVESGYNFYYEGNYRTLNFNDPLYFWVHTDDMKDKLYVKTNEEAIFLSNEFIFLNLSIPKIKNEQLKYPMPTYNTISNSIPAQPDLSNGYISITPVNNKVPVTELDVNTQEPSDAINNDGEVKTPMNLMNILLIFVSVVVILICVVIILMRKGILVYTKSGSGKKEKRRKVKGRKVKKVKKEKKKSKLKFLHKVDNSFDDDLVCLCDYANYMHDEVYPDILVLWKYANFYK